MTECGDQASGDQSSTLAVSPIARRMCLVATELIDYVDKKKADSPFAGHMWFIKSIFEIFFDEMRGQDDEKIGMWIGQFGTLLNWCASGDNSLLPPEILEYIRITHPEEFPEQLAITTGTQTKES